MPLQESSIDEGGLLKRLTQGMGLDEVSAFKEIFDGSEDADSKLFKIIYDKLNHISFENNVCDDEYRDIECLIIQDYGCGMDRERFTRFISLFKENKDSSKTGMYGVGSKAAIIKLSNAFIDNKYDEVCGALVLTKHKNSSNIRQIVFNWKLVEKKLNKSGENNIWTKSISVDNINCINANIWNKYYDDDDSGTLIIILPRKKEFLVKLFSDYFDEEIKGDVLKKLTYSVSRGYPKYFNSGGSLFIKHGSKIKELDIRNFQDPIQYKNISNEDDDSKFEENLIEIFKDSKFDNINYKIINKKYKGTHVLFEERFYICKGNHKYSTKMSLRKSKYFTKFKGDSLFVKDSNSYDLIDDKVIESKFNSDLKITEFTDINVWFSDKLDKDDSNFQKKYCTIKDASLFKGKYFSRNGKILSDPIRLEKCRNTHGKWRGCVIWNNCKIMDSLIKPMVNKSKISKENIDRGLYKLIGYLAKWFIGSYVDEKKKITRLPNPIPIIPSNPKPSPKPPPIVIPNPSPLPNPTPPVIHPNPSPIPSPKPLPHPGPSPIIRRKRVEFSQSEKNHIVGLQNFCCNNKSNSNFEKKYKYECILWSHPKRKGKFGLEGYNIDHIIALCNGGVTEVQNGQALCLSCHRVKTRHDLNPRLLTEQ